MSKTLFDEAIADAKQLREIAENNAKNAIVESVTPRIRDFIEKQLLGQLDSAASTVNESVSDEDVVLDDTAVMELVRLAGGKDLRESVADPSMRNKVLSAAKGASASLTSDQKRRLLNIAKQAKESADSISRNTPIKENDMSRNNRNLLFEVDLNELAKEKEAAEHEGYMHSMDEEDMLVPPVKQGKHAMKPGAKVMPKGKKMVPAEDEGMHYEDDMHDPDMEIDELYTLDEEMYDEDLMEAKLELDLGDDVDLDPDAVISARVVVDEEPEGEVDADEDMYGDAGDMDDMGDMGDMDAEAPEAAPIKLPPAGPKKAAAGKEEESKKLDEVFEIDENMLRRELVRLRSLNEAKAAKNAAAAKASHFGGGQVVGEVDEVEMNKLASLKKEVVKKGRENHALKAKLHEYRSAVETLREQLTDLNLFNAKLLYVNKLLQNRDLSATQRRSIIEALDAAGTLREVKLLYKSLTESLEKSKAATLSESTRRAVGSASRPVASASVKSTEGGEVDRWARLAGLPTK